MVQPWLIPKTIIRRLLVLITRSCVVSFEKKGERKRKKKREREKMDKRWGLITDASLLNVPRAMFRLLGNPSRVLRRRWNIRKRERLFLGDFCGLLSHRVFVVARIGEIFARNAVSFLFSLPSWGRKRGEFQEDPFKTSLSFFGSEVVRREIKDRKLRGYCSILGEGVGHCFGEKERGSWIEGCFN